MSLTPLLNAAPQIQIHAFAAMAALVLGTIQLVAPKGTVPHKLMGWCWVALMLLISGSSFFVHGNSFRLWRSFSPIHLLSIFTPIMLVVAILAVRRHDVRTHAITMILIFVGALVVAGLFTLVPGRIMHDVVLGP